MGAISTMDLDPLDAPSVRIHDAWVSDLPQDLFIPPDAFAVLLDHFEGPLDFLLYLVRQHDMDLRQIDVAPIASQYLDYIEQMRTLDVELAADYLVMAALLADIKSRLLLPKPSKPALEEDPRQTLIDRLEAYAAIKQGASHLARCTVVERDVWLGGVSIQPSSANSEAQRFDAQLLAHAMQHILNRPSLTSHAITTEAVSLEERIAYIQHALAGEQARRFEDLLQPTQGRMGIVVSLMAVLELLRQRVIKIVHDGMYAPLTLRGNHHVN